jgi:hypothetical protein
VGFALAAHAMPSRLVLHPRSLRYALAARATPSWLGLCPRGLRYALVAWALPSWLGFALAAHAMRSRLGLRWRQRWRRRQWKQRWRMLALATNASRSRARALPSRLGFARFALTARATRLWLGFAQTQQSNSKAVAAKAALAVLPPICRSGSGWRQQRWQLQWHWLRQRWRQHQHQWQRWRWWQRQQWQAVAAAAEVAAAIAAAARAAAAAAAAKSVVVAAAAAMLVAGEAMLPNFGRGRSV